MSARYCGRDFSRDDLDRIKQLISEDKTRSRAELSRLTCQQLNWFKADGGLKDMSCRVAMLRMEADGLITLPAPRCKPPSQNKIVFTSQTDPHNDIIRPVNELALPQICPLKTRDHSRLWVGICSCNIDIYHIHVAQ
jgi:hypothetical protein